MQINPELLGYLESKIIPRYSNLDGGHDEKHVRLVIEESLRLARTMNVNINMAYTIAAYHDLGLAEGRERHEAHSKEVLLSDTELQAWFSDEEIYLMAVAVEDHRASANHEPRSIYGRIVADADRDLYFEHVLARTVEYGLSLSTDASIDAHFARAVSHMREKYGENGYLKLWIENSESAERLRILRVRLADKRGFKREFNRVFEEKSTDLRDRKFMARALELAAESANELEVPVGCVIERGGEIIAEGRNRREQGRNALAHAELEAINAACDKLHGWRLTKCTLYVTLEPCPMCAGAIVNARLPRLVYGAADSKAGACGSRFNMFEQGLNHTPSIKTGVLEKECAELLSEFFQKLREKG